MNSFLFSVNAVLPIILMAVIGYFLKRIGLLPPNLAKQLNALVYRLFLPTMLFLNVYKIENFSNMNVLFIIYGAVAILFLFFLGIPLSYLYTKEPNRRGVLIVNGFRSNSALIGIALASSLFGEEGVQAASLLSGVSIPILIVITVITLNIFGEKKEKVDVRKTILDIIKNPLLIGLFIGFVSLFIRAIFEKCGIGFRFRDLEVVYTTAESLSSLATPLALLVLGAQFEFSMVKALKKEIFLGTIQKVIFSPFLILGAALLLFKNQFSGAEFASLIAFFATPAAVSSVPMVQETGGDASLAGQLVVWTTISSALTLFLFIFFFRSIGILV
ncbi:MAG: AEC family transporter [Clostridia bacterium]|nr:AEC family transporter [Clostridia bacterium]